MYKKDFILSTLINIKKDVRFKHNQIMLPQSFFAYLNSQKIESFKEALTKLTPYSEDTQLFDLDQFFIGYNSYLSHNHYYYDSASGQAFFIIGKCYNLDFIFEGFYGITKKTAAEKFFILYQRYGVDIVASLKGRFCICIFNEAKNILDVCTDINGQFPVFYVQNGEELFLTSELKAFVGTDILPVKLINRAAFLKFDQHQQDYSFLKGFKKVIPGRHYRFKLSENKISIQSTVFRQIQIGQNQLSFQQAKDKIYELLNNYVQLMVASDTRVGVPLSGGLDSGIIAALTAKHAKQVKSFTIGTALGNEFQQAKESADFIGTTHEEIFIEETAYFQSVLHGIYLNEFAHPVYAEGFPGFYHVLKTGHEQVDLFLTGYGADLLLGDIYHLEDKSTIAKISEQSCLHTAWTGEFSPFIPRYFNTELVHPFWQLDLINLSISLPSTYKYLQDEVKYVLREMAVEKGLLQYDLAWRKKTAFNVGSSMDKLLAKILGITDYKDYQTKGMFLYHVLENMFSSQQPFDEWNYKDLTTFKK